MVANLGRGEEETRWWWVRHAPVTVNNGCIYGQDDFTCDTSDAAAFALLAGHLPTRAEWVVSNLRRTHETAAAITAAGLAGPASFPGDEVTVIPEFAEQHFGDWQGRTYASLAERSDEEYHRFWLMPAHGRPPGGESFEDLMERVQPAIRKLNLTYPGKDIIAVAHGGTIRAAIALALGLSPAAALQFTTDNLSVTRLDHFTDAAGNGSWQVRYVNRVLG